MLHVIISLCMNPEGCRSGCPELLFCSSVSWVSTETARVWRGDVRDLGPCQPGFKSWLFFLFCVAMGHSLLTSLILDFSLQKQETSLLHRLLGELNKSVWKAPSIVLMHPDCSTNQILLPPSLSPNFNSLLSTSNTILSHCQFQGGETFPCQKETCKT